MPSDFGDESREKLFDWMLRIGEEAGEAAMQASANKLADAFRNTRNGIDEAEPVEAPGEVAERNEWARLSLGEFEQLPEFESIKAAIGDELNSEGIEHAFAQVDGRENLVFRIQDAPAINEAFEKLETNVRENVQRAVDRVRAGRDAKDMPLEEKARQARAASVAHEAAKGIEHELDRVEMRSK